ncbi:MAG TPA: shikimate kinase [Anaerolineae bacterium]|nr:shikimate kinase [Anaerolineae bacterium]HMR64860.1 shikimate kinase [Anaerolineae bacterium]
MKKTLYILVGLKGSGKSYIGSLVDRLPEVCFLKVEPIWVEYLNGHDHSKSGWEVVEAEIDKQFTVYDRVMIESLGAGQEFEAFYASLRRKYAIKLIKVFADLETCLDRVKRRDAANHIPISDSRVEEINQIAQHVTLDWDLVIDNRGPAPASEIIKAIEAIL